MGCCGLAGLFARGSNTALEIQDTAQMTGEHLPASKLLPCNSSRVAVTVALLAQGTNWAAAVSPAFLPGVRTPHWETQDTAQMTGVHLPASKLLHCNSARVIVTVAILAQGTNWAVAASQVFLPGVRTPHWETQDTAQMTGVHLPASKLLRCNSSRVTVTVAILAQGTNWAVAVSQAFLPGVRTA